MQRDTPLRGKANAIVTLANNSMFVHHFAKEVTPHDRVRDGSPKRGWAHGAGCFDLPVIPERRDEIYVGVVQVRFNEGNVHPSLKRCSSQ